ncbi:MAG: Ig-like domain-containing protein, partial [Planctomycetota bacterium]
MKTDLKMVLVFFIFLSLCFVGCNKDKTKDTSPPEAVIETPSDGERMGGSVTITGTATDIGGSVTLVELKIDDGDWTTVEGTDIFSYDWNSSAVADGEHTISIRATDSANNVGEEVSITITIDNTNPTVVITTPENNERVGSTITISGTASDANDGTIASIELKIGTGEWTTITGTHTYSYEWDSSTIAYGLRTIYVRTTDNIGNISTEESISIIVDNTGPIVSITFPSDNSYIGGTIAITGTASDPNDGVVSSVEIQIDSDSWIPLTGTSNWRYSLNTTMLSDGPHTISIHGIDMLNNTGAPVTITLNVDNAHAPAIIINSPANDTRIGGTVTISGTASAVSPAVLSTVEVSIDGGGWNTATGTNTWTYFWDTRGLTSREHTVAVRATDGNNRYGGQNINVIIDNTPPTVTITTPSSGARVGGNVTITGTASDSDGGTVTLVEVKIDNRAWAIATGTSNYAHSWNTTGLSEASHTIQVRAADAVGNVSNPVSVSVTVDNTPPQITSVYPYSDNTHVRTGSNIYLVFSESMNRTSVQNGFRLTRGGSSVTGSFYWRTRPNGEEVMIFSPTSYLADGDGSTLNYTTTLTGATDLAGNMLNTTWVLPLHFGTQDCTPPEAISKTPNEYNVIDLTSFNRQFTVTFNENMRTNSATVRISAIDEWGDSIIDQWLGSSDEGTLTWVNSQTLRLTLESTSQLHRGEAYSISFDDLRDEHDNYTNIEWVFFTRGPSSDTYVPEVISTIPHNGQTNITQRPVIIIFMSEPIQVNTIGDGD